MSLEDPDDLLEDLKFDADLEGFLNGTSETSGLTSLQPTPSTFGTSINESTPVVQGSANQTIHNNKALYAAAAASATVGAVGGALAGGKFAVAQDLLGNALGSVGILANPTATFQTVKDGAANFLQKARSWKQFLIPLSIPAANDGCSRLSANVYKYQSNYGILFVIQLVLTLLWEPSALFSIILMGLVWLGFLKKSEDPLWVPNVMGVKLGPMQRWVAMAVLTAIVFFVMVGGVLLHASLMYALGVAVHGVLHDPSGRARDGFDVDDDVDTFDPV